MNQIEPWYPYDLDLMEIKPSSFPPRIKNEYAKGRDHSPVLSRGIRNIATAIKNNI